VLAINPYRLFAARFLLGLYLLTLINGVVFRHAHRLADGTIVSHAHPYIPIDTGNEPYQPNHHTQQEIIWLDALSNVFYDDWQPALFVLLLPLIVSLLQTFPFSLESVFRPAPLAILRLRGPPAL
jgi:hypothetical protein